MLKLRPSTQMVHKVIPLHNNSMTMLEWCQKGLGLGFFSWSFAPTSHTHTETMKVPKLIWWESQLYPMRCHEGFFDLDMSYCFNVVTKRVRHGQMMGYISV